MKTKRRALVLCYAFPPIAAPEAFVAAKTFAHLDDFEIDLFSVSPAPLWSKDSSLNNYIKRPHIHHRRLRPKGWLRIGRRSEDIPDGLVRTNDRLKRELLRLDLNAYDLVLTRGQWHSVHLLGLDLKGIRPELPWIAHFSDPWVQNPYIDSSTPFYELHKRLEASVLQGVSGLIFTTQASAEVTLKAYPQKLGHYRVVTHPFDPELYPQNVSVGNTLRYFGTFYGDRKPDSLLKALALLRSRGFKFDLDFKVEFFCPKENAQTIVNLARSLGVGSLVKVCGMVSYVESLQKMSEAGALLVIDAPGGGDLFFPSKLVDYLGAGRPIFGVSPVGSPSSLLLAETKQICTDESDLTLIADGLEKTISSMKNPRLNLKSIQKFDARQVAKDYSQALRDLCSF